MSDQALFKTATRNFANAQPLMRRVMSLIEFATLTFALRV
jgi:hypothetical protein